MNKRLNIITVVHTVTSLLGERIYLQEVQSSGAVSRLISTQSSVYSCVFS